MKKGMKRRMEKKEAKEKMARNVVLAGKMTGKEGRKKSVRVPCFPLSFVFLPRFLALSGLLAGATTSPRSGLGLELY
jgi:hypothetical protein